MANHSPIPLTSYALIAVPFAVYLCAIFHSFLTTSPLAPVACPDHNSAAQGEKKQASAQATAECTQSFQACACVWACVWSSKTWSQCILGSLFMRLRDLRVVTDHS